MICDNGYMCVITCIETVQNFQSFQIILTLIPVYFSSTTLFSTTGHTKIKLNSVIKGSHIINTDDNPESDL